MIILLVFFIVFILPKCSPHDGVREWFWTGQIVSSGGDWAFRKFTWSIVREVFAA
jgi:hypothetical protein